MPFQITRRPARAAALACLTLSCMTHVSQAWSQTSFTATELQPAPNGKLVLVRGLDATGRAVGQSDVSKGLKYDILIGFHIKYEDFSAEWPVATTAMRPVALKPSGIYPELVNAPGHMAGYDSRNGTARRVVVDSQGQVLQTLEHVGMLSGMNDKGWVVGYSDIESGLRLPALWRDGNMIRLAMGDYAEGQAHAINASGQVAGYLRRYGADGVDIAVPVRWTNGQIDWVGPAGAPPGPNTNIGARFSRAAAIGIDDRGTVLFEIDEDDGMGDRKLVTYLRGPGGDIVKALTPEGAPMRLVRMNARGDAIGSKLDGSWAPVIRKADGSVIDLAQWAKSGKIKLPAGAGTLTGCSALNDQGMLVCETKAWGLFASTYKRLRLMPK